MDQAASPAGDMSSRAGMEAKRRVMEGGDGIGVGVGDEGGEGQRREEMEERRWLWTRMRVMMRRAVIVVRILQVETLGEDIVVEERLRTGE